MADPLDNVLLDDTNQPLLDDTDRVLGDELWVLVYFSALVYWQLEASTRSFMMRNQLIMDRPANAVGFRRDLNALVFRLETTGTYVEEW